MPESARTALVTGASGVLGACVACVLHVDGWKLMLHGFSRPAALDGLNDELGSMHRTYSSDLGTPDGCDKAVQTALEAFGKRLDALVHCAGISDDDSFAKMTDDRFMRVIDVNLSSAMHLCRSLARTFARQKSGSVVFIGSYAGINGRRGGTAYAAAKAGLSGLAKSLAREWAIYNVCVNVVVPGFMPGTGMSPDSGSEKAAEIAGTALLGAQDPSEVARFIGTLLNSKKISGQILNTDSRILA